MIRTRFLGDSEVVEVVLAMTVVIVEDFVVTRCGWSTGVVLCSKDGEDGVAKAEDMARLDG